MKNILLVYPPKEKASSNYYFRVRQEIAIMKRNYKVKILAPISKTDTVSQKQHVIIRLLKLLATLPRLVKLIAWSDYVMIYASPMWYLTAPLSKLLRKKVIVEHFITSVYNFELSHMLFKKLFLHLDFFTYRLFDLVITHTDTMKDLIVSSYGFDKKKVLVLYNYSDTKKFRKISKNYAFIRELGLKRGCKIVLYHGLFHKFHGVDVILEAAKLLENNNNICFLLVGRKLDNVPKNVISIRTIGYDELYKYFSIADIWVGMFGTDLQGERAMSSSMITAMTAGIPVIVGDWHENKMIIKDGFNGFIIKRGKPSILANKIVSVLGQNKLKSIGKSARSTIIKSYSQKVMGSNLLEAVNNL